MGTGYRVKFYAVIRLTIFAFAGIMLLQGCSTTYMGPTPDLTLKGDEAQKEIRKFSLKEGFFSQGGGDFQMGPDEKWYTKESLRPVVTKISPAAVEMMSSAQKYRQVGRILGGIGDVALLWAIFFTSDSATRQILGPVALVGIGSSLGLGIKAGSDFSSAAEQYNKDLRQKLSPTVTANLKF